MADDSGQSWVDRLRARHPWLDHLVWAALRYNERNGNHYAAAITFFSVLSLVPLLMIAFAVAGYVLFFNPALLGQLRAAMTANMPPALAATLNPIIDQAIAERNTVAGFGLVAAAYSGIKWMSNLREALSEQWAQVPQTPALPKRLLFDLLALTGLGLALAASFSITGLASRFTAEVLVLLGYENTEWGRILLGVVGVLLAIAANYLVFLWVIARLPRRHVSLRNASRAAFLGAIGFEALKRVMSYYLGVVSNSPSGAVFGGLLGLFVFAYFMSRFVLLVTAWAATSRENRQEELPAVPASAVIRPQVVVQRGPDGRTAAGLVAAGMVMGLLGVRLVTGNRRR